VSQAASRERIEGEIMSKFETMTTDIRELRKDELKVVSGGMDLKGMSDPLTQRSQAVSMGVDLKGASDSLGPG
jgi:hypothetical protein